MLFDETERTETRPKREREPAFTYLSSSARPMVAAVRQVLEQWFGLYFGEGMDLYVYVIIYRDTAYF